MLPSRTTLRAGLSARSVDSLARTLLSTSSCMVGGALGTTRATRTGSGRTASVAEATGAASSGDGIATSSLFPVVPCSGSSGSLASTTGLPTALGFGAARFSLGFGCIAIRSGLAAGAMRERVHLGAGATGTGV